MHRGLISRAAAAVAGVVALATLVACGSTDGDSAFPDPSSGPIAGAPAEGIDQPNASIPAGALNA